ncbi:probable calcium-binding protein cml10 [Phtheirospermum japonicum]|uniref:Probable calcium-binding protein cml10 n=1 Tax=Phtheirospermum japonicum TaxID=374723 RepID=A0A830D7R4_9LAMI|nr:probable calcium-binding protein cml10 [Phtheirospermum japonicum]
MLDSMKLCLSSQTKQAKKLLQKLNLSEKLRSWKRIRKPAYSDLSWLTSSSFPAMEISTQLKQVFNLIDTNRDGKLSTLELKQVLLILGHETKSAGQEAEAMVSEMDFDGDGFVDLDEFMRIMKNHDSPNHGVFRESEIMEAFRVFDADSDGLISAEELHRVLARLWKCSVRECRKMIKGVDRDGDGFVNFEEFKTMMNVGC